MARYSNDSKRVLKRDLQLIIPHGGDDAESSSTVTRMEFKKGDTVRFIKAQVKVTLKALGLKSGEAKSYILQAFNNFEDL
tara:strand:+ start:680 stop:919 length:240 start_codon:yes stop_codon:yes gene_type:complete